MDIKMYNFKIKPVLLVVKLSKAQANKTSIKFMIVHSYIRKKTGYNTICYMISQYGLKQVLIQRILIGFEAILEIFYLDISDKVLKL